MRDEDVVYVVYTDWLFDEETQCYKDPKTGLKFCVKEDRFGFVYDEVKDNVPQEEAAEKEILPLHLGTGHGQSIHGEKASNLDVVDELSPELGEIDQESAEKKILPLHFSRGNGQSIHEEKASNLDVVDKLSPELGEVEQAESGVTEEDPNKKGRRSDGTSNSDRNSAPKKRKIGQCSWCGETGHNRRTCPKLV